MHRERRARAHAFVERGIHFMAQLFYGDHFC
jgi:hypothetical protein